MRRVRGDDHDHDHDDDDNEDGIPFPRIVDIRQLMLRCSMAAVGARGE